MPRQVEFLEPASLDQAIALLQQRTGGALMLAGGTALVPMLTHRAANPDALVSLARIPGLDFIRHEPDGLHLGALASLRAVERSDVVRAFCPALAAAYGVVANVHVRNQATVGGSLAAAEHDSDPPTVLLALDARVRTVRAAGEREFSLPELFRGESKTALAADEIIAEVIVPPLPASARAAYLRQTKRSHEARPSVNVAAVVAFDSDSRVRDLRVAVGAAVERPRRLAELEAQAASKEIVTVEGLAQDGRLHPVQQAFIDHAAFQCAFCTPGFILSAVALLRENPVPNDDEIRDYLGGNRCRCGSYPNILEAVKAAGTPSRKDRRRDA